MKKINILIILLIISLPVTILLTTIEIATFDSSFYERKYEEYNVPMVTGIEMEDLIFVTDEMLDYLKGKREDLIIFTKVNGKTEQVFEEREILHMIDVKDLFDKGYKIRNTMILISIISFIFIYKYSKEKIGKTFIIASIWPMVLGAIIGILMYVDFNKYFNYFHEIFFSNDLWLLNPKTDILIQMLPIGFFISIATKILSIFIIELIVILIIGKILNRIIEKKEF